MRHKSGLVSGGGSNSGSSSGPSPTKNKPGSSSSGSSGPPVLFPGIANTSASNVAAEAKIKDMLKELYHLIHQVQDERTRGEHNLSNIGKTHERILQEQKISPYYKSKLKGLYNTAMQDAESEAELLRKALDKINEVKSFRNERRDGPPKQVRRRGVLMSMLQQNALTLPLWIGKPGEKPPPLCGATPAESTYIAKPRDKVAARVKGQDGEENWILSEVVSFNSSTNKFEVDDIDAEEGKERHVLSRRRIVPLPVWKANPETDPEALFPAGTLVLALYPQTTCFYRALIHDPPKRPHDDYSLLFEDNSYPDGYSPPLNVAQRYVILCKDDKKK
ncbi:SAGA-associated factor 29 [Lingula anatina]|uniref:SAGA-associated factor 29 n=1 Tax=Lingula anatina TaxID=7574 RepID=A0A1S3IJY4_LINAN|nr:SAGA-associated factor 29 [Lingula anatina]|eukprot:XP_013398555.1 SAGA-associated factor 29 [Lingula anatina]